MNTSETFLRLQKELLLMQGFKAAPQHASHNGGLSLIKEAFPAMTFPLAAVHEFICGSPEETSASTGFISGIVSSLMKQGGVSAWIGASGSVYPHALAAFGIEPDKIFFIETRNEKEKLWTLEESLKCEGLSAVIADISDLSFTNSRRLQLAVEQSGVTGFLLRKKSRSMLSCAVTQWQINPIVCEVNDDLPGLHFPQWSVALIKVRNGKPGRWQMEWSGGKFRHVQPDMVPVAIPVRKVV